jgi:hypothetical protein
MEETITLPPEEYTVGWICAIEPELKVARAMLDRTHSAITEQDPHDDNIYTLGVSDSTMLSLLVCQNTESRLQLLQRKI